MLWPGRPRGPAASRAVRDSIPVTPIPETILDLCAVSRNHDIPLRALDDVGRRKLVSSFELERCLVEHAPQRLPGLPLDLAYRRPKIATECLGKTGHFDEKAFEEDPVRSNDFALDGWLQLLVTYRRREDSPESIVAEVEAALAVRGGV